MNAMTDREFGLAMTREELVLRRRLLFWLLKGFDFNAPVLQGEAITPLIGRGQDALFWAERG